MPGGCLTLTWQLLELGLWISGLITAKKKNTWWLHLPTLPLAIIGKVSTCHTTEEFLRQRKGRWPFSCVSWLDGQTLESLQTTKKLGLLFICSACTVLDPCSAVARMQEQRIKYDQQSFRWCCYVTVDFATAAIQNSVCITQQMCHIMNLFDEYYSKR
jgi:hypothetical protein